MPGSSDASAKTPATMGSIIVIKSYDTAHVTSSSETLGCLILSAPVEGEESSTPAQLEQYLMPVKLRFKLLYPGKDFSAG